MEVGFEINPLANPKGVKLVCHLCQKPARIQCPGCRSTYYCCVDDQTTDWDGIHSQVCELLASLRAYTVYASSEAERKHQHKLQQQTRDKITEISLTEGRKYLHNRNYVLAFPPSLLALKLLTETHGLAHLQLTPALLLLAQSALGQGKLRNAEQFLSQAQWAVLQNSSASSSLHSQLHRNLGLLATSKGDYLTARKHFAEDIYQSSLGSGPESIQTVGGLFHLGEVFLKENKPSVALSFFEKVVKIWLTQLDGTIQEMITISKMPSSAISLPGKKNPFDTVNTMNIAEIVEAKQHLQTVLSLREFHSLVSLSLTYWAYFTSGLLHIVMKDYPQSINYIDEALKVKANSEAVEENMARTQISELKELISVIKKSFNAV